MTTPMENHAKVGNGKMYDSFRSGDTNNWRDMDASAISTASNDDFGGKRPFKEKKSFHQRVAESRNIKARFPNKVPVIVERHKQENNLPMIDKTKYLVPQELSMSQFVIILRTRMHLEHSQALYMLVNEKHVVSMTTTISHVYQEHRDEDGFLYLTYASQEMFGADCCHDDDGHI